MAPALYRRVRRAVGANVFGSLFQKRRKKPSGQPSEETIRDVRQGDVFTLSGFGLEYEDGYFLVDKKNRYESASANWHEILGVDGDKRLWVEWAGDRGDSVSVRPDDRPVGLSAAGLTEEDLVRLDEERSIDNRVEYDGARFDYVNSGEAFFYEQGVGAGQGFYLWEFASDDGSRLLSVVKWEATPFQVYVSELLSPESFAVYRR